ncbi:MAG TPA: hypothetical protein VF624_14295 [Tepidisphaeraceae bacterium]|jgi:hypothetical protein
MIRHNVHALFAAAVLLLAAPVEAGATWSFSIVYRGPRPPTARELAARASRAGIDASRARFMAAHRTVTRDHPLTAEIEAAGAELLKAQQEIDFELSDARAEMRADPDYRKLAAVDNTFADKIAAENDAQRRTALAQDRLAVRAKLSAMESKVLAGNLRVRAARTAAAEARKKLAGLELERRLFLLKVPELAAAKTQLATARSSLVPSR